MFTTRAVAAAMYSAVAITKTLLENGANPSAQNDDEVFPLQIAAWKNSVSIANNLIGKVVATILR